MIAIGGGGDGQVAGIAATGLDLANQRGDGIGTAKCLEGPKPCLLYTSPSPRDLSTSRMPSSA